MSDIKYDVSDVPEEFQQVEPAMTSKQSAFISDLLKKKIKPEDRVRTDEVFAKGLTKKQASTWIEKLLKMPDLPRDAAAKVEPPSDLPDVPQGRYAVEVEGTLKFYKIDKPTDGRWAGWTFVKALAGGGHVNPYEHRIKDRSKQAEIMQTILDADPAECAKRYGIELGRCGVCGRTLTDETSREYGIGPVCRESTGW